MSGNKCSYCGSVIDNNEEFCNDQCKHEYKEFNKFLEKRKNFFGVLVAISIIVTFVGSIVTVANVTFGISTVAMAMFLLCGTMLVLPFGTPETFERLGVKKTVLLVRSLSIIIIIVTIICLIM